MLRLGRSVYLGQFSAVGEPTKEKILWICSISDLPGRRGLLRISSPIMQPKLHMSIAVEYSFTPAPEAKLAQDGFGSVSLL